MVNVNHLDARTLGQPGGFFDRLTQAVNLTVHKWGETRDRQAQRKKEAALLQHSLDRQAVQDHRQDERDAADRVQKATVLAGEGIPFQATGNADQDALLRDLYNDRLRDRQLKRSQAQLGDQVARSAAARNFGILPEPTNIVQPDGEFLRLQGLANEGSEERDIGREAKAAVMEAQRAKILQGLILPAKAPVERPVWTPVKGEDGKDYRFNRVTGERELLGLADPGQVMFPTPDGDASPVRDWILKANAYGNPAALLSRLLGARPELGANAAPDEAATAAVPSGQAPATAPISSKPPVSLSQARAHPQFAGMNDGQIRALAAQQGRQVIP